MNRLVKKRNGYRLLLLINEYVRRGTNSNKSTIIQLPIVLGVFIRISEKFISRERLNTNEALRMIENVVYNSR